jgi:hypothetical protein
VCAVVPCDEIISFLANDLAFDMRYVPEASNIEVISFTAEQAAAMTAFNADMITMRHNTSSTVANFMFDNINIVGALLEQFQELFTPGFEVMLAAVENLVFDDPDFGQDVQEVIVIYTSKYIFRYTKSKQLAQLVLTNSFRIAWRNVLLNDLMFMGLPN